MNWRLRDTSTQYVKHQVPNLETILTTKTGLNFAFPVLTEFNTIFLTPKLESKFLTSLFLTSQKDTLIKFSRSNFLNISFIWSCSFFYDHRILTLFYSLNWIFPSRLFSSTTSPRLFIKWKLGHITFLLKVSLWFPNRFIICMHMFVYVHVCMWCVCAWQPSTPGPSLLAQTHSYSSLHFFRICSSTTRWSTTPQPMSVYWNANTPEWIYPRCFSWCSQFSASSRFSKASPDSSSIVLPSSTLSHLYLLLLLLWWLWTPLHHPSQPLDF